MEGLGEGGGGAAGEGGGQRKVALKKKNFVKVKSGGFTHFALTDS